jgi:thymidylate kinase
VSTLQLEAGPARTSPPLVVVTELSRGLHEAGVSYCHWKSNEHLHAAVQGDTDLDLLVDRQSALRVTRVLAEAGYKRMVAIPARAYVGIEDYLALDHTTGKLVHVHLHYRLIVGEKFLKGHRLPWEERMLAGRRLDLDTGMYVTAPELELIVLLVRAALKLRRREILGFGGGGPGDHDFLRELRWLSGRADPVLLRSEATDLLGRPGAEMVAALMRAEPDRAMLVRFGRAIAGVTQEWRTYPAAEATRRRWMREWSARSARLWSRVLGVRRVTRFHDPRGGVIIAFLGADGSGKSTVTNAVASWLSWRMEVLPLYLGFGDGPVSWVRMPLRGLKLLYARRRRLPAAPQELPRESSAREMRVPSLRDIPRALWLVLWSWSVVREKRSRLRQARRGRNLGLVVLCDRYPQAQIMGLGDGPLLGHWERHPWAWLRAVAKWELEAYREMEAVVPDLVIKLHVSPEVSAARKQDVSLDSLVRRVDVVKRVHFSARTQVAHVDADEPIEQVLLEVQRAIWEAL